MRAMTGERRPRSGLLRMKRGTRAEWGAHCVSAVATPTFMAASAGSDPGAERISRRRPRLTT
jgi:hypothetical protein